MKFSDDAFNLKINQNVLNIKETCQDIRITEEQRDQSSSSCSGLDKMIFSSLIFISPTMSW
jgi:hypothetical protein